LGLRENRGRDFCVIYFFWISWERGSLKGIDDITKMLVKYKNVVPEETEVLRWKKVEKKESFTLCFRSYREISSLQGYLSTLGERLESVFSIIKAISPICQGKRHVGTGIALLC
jgi:hypothetical protein